MLKNILFNLLSLTMLAVSTVSLAADNPSDQEAVPATVIPAEQQASTPSNETVSQTSINTRPNNDNHTDYRYCLELKTNIEIAQCRYKKK